MFEDVYILVLKDEEQKRFFMRKYSLPLGCELAKEAKEVYKFVAEQVKNNNYRIIDLKRNYQFPEKIQKLIDYMDMTVSEKLANEVEKHK